MSTCSSSAPARLAVRKTFKLYVGGAWVRSESGATISLPAPDGTVTVPLASRKDARDAVRAARGAQGWWAELSPYNRGQILYRVAEHLESQSTRLAAGLARTLRCDPAEAGAELDWCTDRFVYWAGWTDKVAAVLGAPNPVSAGAYLSISVPEPAGVVAAILAGHDADGAPPFALACEVIGAALACGNTIVVATEAQIPAILELGEAIAISDVPAGCVNLLSAGRPEVAVTLAEHRDVDAVTLESLDPGTAADLEQRAAGNLKRVWRPHAVPVYHPTRRVVLNELVTERLEHMSELKTIWSSVGR